MVKKIFFALTLTLMTAATAWSQAFNIGGHRAAQDTLNGIWLCSIPQALFGTDFKAAVTWDDEVFTDFAINDSILASGDEFTFEDISGGKVYAVSAHIGDSLVTGNITFTWLPIVELYGEFGNKYHVGNVIVSEPDSTDAAPLLAKAKWRGRATNIPGKNKRNYRIKFINEDSTKVNHRFFGLRDDNSWILDAGQIDFLRVRNRVSTDLWLDMARRPWYADTLPNCHNGSRGQMVEVLLNGKYHGIYNMCEPIDRKQLKLKKYDEATKQIRGALWEAETWSRTVAMSNPADRAPGVQSWDGFTFEYPDWEETHTVHWKTLNDAVWFAHDNCDDEFIDQRVAGMGDYFDIPVMQDYFIFITALQALDNESKNIFYGCREIYADTRVTMTPWDLDVCLGQNYSPEVSKPDMVKPERGIEWISHIPMASMWETYEYHNQVVNRYKELRETLLSNDNLVNRYRNAINELNECGATEREENRWSGDTDLAGKTLDLNAEMDYVEDWIRRHMDYLDENVFIPMENPTPDPVKGDVNGDGEVNIADVNAVIDIILGGTADPDTMKRADVNGDGEINIADVNAIIDIILS